ncbi:DEAD/DEAH box helicase [bacterium]|nr:DEAD/DEAH box helicase [bacterium]
MNRLHPGILSIVKKGGWDRLTPIQVAAFEPIYQGQDAILEAPTAGGKTEAVFFPLLTREAGNGSDSVRILYLAPLKALLNNIESRVEKYSKACGMNAFKWHGDVDNRKKWLNFEEPAQILMTTPESLEAILIGKSGWNNFFKDIKTIIIDEAHNFAAGDRGCHLACLMERLETSIAKKPQRIALTATIGNPERMLKWLAGKNREIGKRIHIDLKVDKDRDILLKYFDSSSEDENTPSNKTAAYRLFASLRDELPTNTNRALVFVRARKTAESYAKAFAEDAKRNKGVPIKVRVHHGSVAKYFREQAELLIQIKNESGINAIICTSTLELGIDIGALKKVLQIGCTPSPSAFLQRIGRTGRRKEESQYFRGLISDPDELTVMTGVVSLGMKNISEALLFPTNAYHILAHQIICLARQTYGISPDKAWSILSSADCFSGIGRKKYDNLVDHLKVSKILRDVDGDVVVGEKGEKIFLSAGSRRLFAVFETGPMFEVWEGKNQVGFLGSGFVYGLANDTPFYFVLAGILWKAAKVNLESHTVIAERSKDGDPPAWDSFGGRDVPFETAQEIGRLLVSNEPISYLDDHADCFIEVERNRWSEVGWNPGNILGKISMSNSGHIITFAGDKINRTIAKLLVCRKLVAKNNISADYSSIEIKSHKAEVPFIDSFKTFWKEIKAATSDDLKREIMKVAPSKPYSRLTAQLPEDLLKITYLDNMIDIEGLKSVVNEFNLK